MKGKRHVYLKMTTREEARDILMKRFSRLQVPVSEEVSSSDAVGRVLAEPAFARISCPNFHAAAMDGIAVKAEDTFGVNEAHPKQLAVGKDTFFINTGQIMPEGTNAVIMIEHVQVLDENTLKIESAAYPWQHVRKMGEDIVATELLFPQNHLVTPTCLGALLSGGVFSVRVKERPRVLIIPTGSELKDWTKVSIDDIGPGDVLETNSWVLGRLVEENGGEWIRHSTVPDEHERVRASVEQAVKGDAHIVLVLAGSSAGSEDHTANVIQDLGEVMVHGVTIMPGKPVVLGAVMDKPVIGVPGYPVSSIVTFDEFIRPLLCRMLGQPERPRTTVQVVPTRKIASRLGVEELVRVKLGRVGMNIVATPLPRGAGSITTFTEADGIIRIPNEVEGVRANEPVTAELLRPESAIEDTIVVVGSHDNSLDILADAVKARNYRFTLSSSHVGSTGGLMAIKAGVCHFAGSHLLDTLDGSYNISYIKRYIPDIPVRVVNLVFRDQGFIIRRGNPKHIKGIEDLSREDVVFINRQGGSGTRILLDYRLKELGIEPERIQGYGTEEFTHMAVAVAVLSGAADVGLGIFAAAQALDLDFIPVVTEQYDIVIPSVYFETEKIQTVLDIINSAGFKKRLESMGGYHTERTGEVLL
jgi:molybdopterin molybdotransferase/putative molybdopterin biosynthesis protein